VKPDGGEIARIVAQQVGTGHLVRTGPTWTMVAPLDATLPEHGWKIHVSARKADYPDLVAVLLPALLDAGCAFKLARSLEVLGKLNDGFSSPETVGKAFTIYPDPASFQELALKLADLLRDRPGPRVLSDRRVRPDAPVYYRYGPFSQSWKASADGRLLTKIHGPAGEEFGALATMRYRQPEWVTDPFTGEAGEPDDLEHADHEPAEPQLIGGHYRITAGLFESGRGNVYRAIDERTGVAVVVKQARALVDEHDEAGDVRIRLRNERRVLEALAGVPGIPQVFDHFRHGSDEFLATSDLGPLNLSQDVVRNGRYLPADDPAADPDRTLDRLGRQLAAILRDLHDRGVVMHDLAPKNIVVDGENVSLVDFGHAYYEGFGVGGATPGYAPARQRRGEQASDVDDLHALGMTLLSAALYVRPVTLDDDHEIPRIRALQSLRTRFGSEPAGIAAVVADLLSDDPDLVRAAARTLAEKPVLKTKPTKPLPTLPAVTGELAARVTDNLRADLLVLVDEILSAPAGSSTAYDASIYSGSAGIGLELLEHLDQPGVAERVQLLADFSVRAAKTVELPPGLLLGRTGVDVFLQRAHQHGVEIAGYSGPTFPATDWKPESVDVIAGAAGVGLGHLSMHRSFPDPAHLEIVRRCVTSVLDGNFDQDPLPERTAVEPSVGRAHGLAGTTEFLLSAGEHEAAREFTERLTKRAESLLQRMGSRYTLPLSVSWCQGLAGVAQTLLHAGDVFGDPKLTALAYDIGRASTDFLPFVIVPIQCCGLTGVGNMVIDLALRSGEKRHWEAADLTASHILMRGGGTYEHPVLVDKLLEDGSASLAFGIAGILGFFRRLSQRAGEFPL
jgi:hypothetical protein